MEKTLLLIAYEFGKIAFEKGIKRIFCLDSNGMKMLEGTEIGNPLNIPIMKAWYKGWDIANLQAEV